MFNLAGVIEAGARTDDGPGARELIVCEALIDALTFWVHGFTNVTSAYGVEGFSEDMLAAIKAAGIERVFIAFDRDAAGERGAEALAERLMAVGIEALQVQFPRDMDANSYALERGKKQPAAHALGMVLRQARWLGRGTADRQDLAPEVAQPVEPEPVVDEAPPAASTAEPPSLAAEDLTTQTLDNGVYFASGGGYGRRGISATELALSGGLGALPGVVNAGKGLVSNLRSSELGMFRRTSNTGAFADLPVLMDLKTVRSYAAEAGVGLDGVKVKIVRDESLIGRDLFGYAAPNGKSITLYPDAFSNPEELVRTLGHERMHVYQARTFGAPQGIPELNLNEAAAYGLEDSFVKYWRSRGGH